MEVTLAYRGSSTLTDAVGGRMLSLAANRAREAVSFDAELQDPVRFREAICTLHDVVINDSRYQPRDKTSYHVYRAEIAKQEAAIRTQAYAQAKEGVLAARANVPADLEEQYEQKRKQYWSARRKYFHHLRVNDPSLWRKFMPLDPVITVADDVVFFECFSADESSYGCLTASRDDVFGHCNNLKLGTTNIDYSWELYQHFQTLRSYRRTRFQVDPEGMQVATEGTAEHREEKIDLPPSWLRGFMQIQVAMGLPMRRVSLSRGATYNLLAWLKRHRARTSPRAMRWELTPGTSPRIVLEPWEKEIVSTETIYDGPETEPIRIWGSRRLLMLARLLPLIERVDVYLLGTGLPSFWVAHLGEMRLTLGLSGWTANDWSSGSALDSLSLPANPSDKLVARAADYLRIRRSVSFDELSTHLMTKPATCAAALNQLAHSGQAIYDLAAGAYRWRQIMPQALGEAQLGPENPEAVAARELVGRVRVVEKLTTSSGALTVTGRVEGKDLTLLLDADGTIKQGTCSCSHHFKSGIRRGACRHLLALRQRAMQPNTPETESGWYDRLVQWARH